MAHVLILGMTMSGKSELGKNMAVSYRRHGIKTVALDPLNDWREYVDYSTRDPEEFLRVVKQSERLAIFIDESGETIGRYNEQMTWLATRARHYGHRSHFMSQRAAQLSKTVRDQCSDLFVFRVSKGDAKVLAEEFTDDDLLAASTLGQYEYLHLNRFGKVQRHKSERVKF